MVAPALSSMVRDLHITSQIETSLVLSIFVLAYAVGPLFLGPCSEGKFHVQAYGDLVANEQVYGRVKVIQIANMFYLAWNLGCGFAKTKGQMMAFRFLAGLGGSAPLAIGGGVLSDIFTADERGKAISIYSLMPLLGPALGPIAGGFIAENTTWRWVFWSTTCLDALIQLSGFFFLQETYAPTILAKKSARLRKETGNAALHTEWEGEKKLSSIMKTALIRPFKLLGTQIIIQIIAFYQAYLYGLMVSLYLIYLKGIDTNTLPVPHPLDLPRSLDHRLPRINRHWRSKLHFPRNRILPRHTDNGSNNGPHLPPSQDQKQWYRQTRIPRPLDVHRFPPRPHRSILVRLVRPSTHPLDHAQYRRRHLWCRYYRLFPVYTNLYR